MSKNIVIVDHGNRSWLERVLAAIFYTCAFYLVIKFVLNVEPELGEKYIIKVLKMISFLIFILTFAVYYSLTKSFHFDLIKKEYRTYYQIGSFGYGKWQKHLDFKYIVIYLNSNESYLANIWDVKNNRITVGYFDDLKSANEFGADLSKKLNIRFQERKENK